MLANVSPQTASNHLKLLLDAGFLKVTAKGRNKFYTLSGRPVAAALESLAAASHGKKSFDGLPQRGGPPPELVFARTCYDHLAGELGVAILNRLRKNDYLRQQAEEYRLTVSGEDFLHRLGIDVGDVQAKRRRFAYACLDWSHRVPHLGGALAAALLDWLFRNRVVVRRKASRAIRLTDHGEKQLSQIFAIRLTRNRTAIADR